MDAVEAHELGRSAEVLLGGLGVRVRARARVRARVRARARARVRARVRVRAARSPSRQAFLLGAVVAHEDEAVPTAVVTWLG